MKYSLVKLLLIDVLIFGIAGGLFDAISQFIKENKEDLRTIAGRDEKSWAPASTPNYKKYDKEKDYCRNKGSRRYRNSSTCYNRLYWYL